MKKLQILSIAVILLMTLSTIGSSSYFTTSTLSDFDPLVDLSVTVEIQKIRFLCVDELKTSTKKTATATNPNLYAKVFINDMEFTSPIWSNTKYVYDTKWSASLNVPDDQEFVTITIQLWSDEAEDVAYDLSGDRDSYDVTMTYSIATGQWTGDDSRGDLSGYGRLCGCDDGTTYENDRDCELWFTITQTDYDGDGIPYWVEINTYNTNPMINDASQDPDNDTIPTFWEYRWEYDPLTWEDQKKLDPDGDSINNYEEFLTSAWSSDPFRKDVFVEMDIMGDGPNGEKTYFPENSKELILTTFSKQNIMFHLDDGAMGGSDIIPFDNNIGRSDLNNIYSNYFLHGDPNTWRRGVFHYGLVIYYEDIPGYMFRSNGYQIASSGMETKDKMPFLETEIIYASAYIHELGHTLSFYPIPGHNSFCKGPWQIGWWLARPYRSCMNYAWMYEIVDYSDGSRQSPDLDDWSRIDYSAFEQEWG